MVKSTKALSSRSRSGNETQATLPQNKTDWAAGGTGGELGRTHVEGKVRGAHCGDLFWKGQGSGVHG